MREERESPATELWRARKSQRRPAPTSTVGQRGDEHQAWVWGQLGAAQSPRIEHGAPQAREDANIAKRTGRQDFAEHNGLHS